MKLVHDPPNQVKNLLKKIGAQVRNGKYRFSRHAIQRQGQRSISPQDILYVLTHGFHEENKTSFDTKFRVWKYAIRGKTMDHLDIRVIVALVKEMVIITVIRITPKNDRRKS